MKILVIALSLFLLQATTVVAQTSTTDAIKNYSVEKKNEAAAHSKKLVSDFDVKIKELETQVSKDAGAADNVRLNPVTAFNRGEFGVRKRRSVVGEHGEA